LDNLRELIAERVRANGGADGHWVLDAYCHLLQRGASPEHAAEAMSSFVNEIVAEKARRDGKEPANDPPEDN
jgi:hypothetical protein